MEDDKKPAQKNWGELQKGKGNCNSSQDQVELGKG